MDGLREFQLKKHVVFNDIFIYLFLLFCYLMDIYIIYYLKYLLYIYVLGLLH